MSVFLNRVHSYCEHYQVPLGKKIALIGHYPLFKAHWHASYGQGFRKKFSQRVVALFRGHRLQHGLTSPNGQKMEIPISFEPEDLSSFQEIFWGGEYALPWDISKAKSYVDLGANTGMAALYFLALSPLQKIILVEANPELVKTLTRNVPMGTVENVCISGSSGEKVTFYISDGHRHSSLEPIAGGRKIAHQTHSLSELFSRHQLETVDILKMDIEGAEFCILEKDIAALKRCGVIVAEIHGFVNQRDRFCLGLERLGFEIIRQKVPYPDCETIFARNQKYF